MQQTIGITIILSVFLTTLFVGGDVFAVSNGKGRPIQVVSDPYNIGNPTHYTVIRGNSKITFSHPLAGQFGRAEISVREKSANRITRFILSPDRKTYRVALQMETSFAKHNSTNEASLCPDPNGPTAIKMVKLLRGKVTDGEEIAKKRDELTKSKFFDASCFDPSFPEDHRNALFNAAADVVATSTRDENQEPKYLRCLEKNGFSHESGVVQALVQQSITDTKVNPRIRITCTADKNAKPAQFDDETREASIKKTPKAIREDYAVKVFHELLHAAPLPDGSPLEAMEDCCTRGEQCEILKAYGQKRASGEKKIAIAEAISGKSVVATGELTVANGPSNEAYVMGAPSSATSNGDRLETTAAPTLYCKIVGKKTCDRNNTDDFDRLTNLGACVPNFGAKKAPSGSARIQLINLLVSESLASTGPVTCENDIRSGTLFENIRQETRTADQQTAAQLMEAVPQTSPIEWDTAKAVPLRMASNNNLDASDATAPTEAPRPPSRTIASISPLPDEAPQRRLGSTANRADVATGRATMLVDTMESAARRVTVALTPENLDARKVDKVAIFANDYKPTTKNPQYVVASLATGVMKVADFGDMKGLDFPNPFANVKQKVDRDTGLFTTSKVDPKDPKQVAKTSDQSKKSATAANASSEDETSTKKTASAGSAGMSGSVTSGGGTATTNSDTRAPSSKTKHDFKTIDRAALLKFVTSGYRDVAADLDDKDFKEALGRYGIQILDHEGRRIGSMKPETRFVYRSDVNPPRLVPTRADRNGK